MYRSLTGMILFLFSLSYSASLGIDLKAGANLTFPDHENGLYLSTSFPINFTEIFALVPEISFIALGKTYDDSVWAVDYAQPEQDYNRTAVEKLRISQQFIEIPLLLRWRLSRKKIKPSIAIGQSISVWINHVQKAEGVDKSNFSGFITEDGFVPNNSDRFKPAWSVRLGIFTERFGVEIPLSRGHLLIEQRYQLTTYDYTASETVPYEGVASRLSHEFSLHVGYGFLFRRKD